MRLRHAMFAGGISGFPLFGANLAPAGYAALKLRPDFVASSFFERIGATKKHQYASDRD
jgi:hypothetical protein